MKWHAIFKEDGRIQDCEFEAAPDLELAEAVFTAAHPNATYWELGRPLVEIEYNAESEREDP